MLLLRSMLSLAREVDDADDGNTCLTVASLDWIGEIGSCCFEASWAFVLSDKGRGSGGGMDRACCVVGVGLSLL
jgi:hypothetical protein